MKVIRTHSEWKPLWLKHLQADQQIGFVPTMGALHEGHLDLVRASRSQTDVTLVSIFVNPTQFNNPEDFAKYPSTIEEDLKALETAGVDYVFIPTVETMYSSSTRMRLDFGDLELILEGEFRPGHFNGVGLVVSKLFHLIKPHFAFFGQKDLQQVAIVRRLVNDLSFDLKLVVVPTRREEDGLAMSSRNLRLNPEERQQALILFKSLQKAKFELLKGRNWLDVKKQIIEDFSQSSSSRLEYFQLVHPETFEFQDAISMSSPASICVAAFVGPVRLIDNMAVIE